MSSSKIYKKISIIVFTIILTFTLGYAGFIYYKDYRIRMPYIATSYQMDLFNPRDSFSSRDEIIEEINNTFQYNRYSLYYDELPYRTLGQSNIIKRTIYIDNNLDDKNFIFTLGHEIIHIRDFTTCERYCNYQTFITLFNSDNDYFKDVAKWYLSLDLNAEKDIYYYEYSFAGNVLEYLEKQGRLKGIS